ncbi:MAG TPA: hypothetical protein VFM34_04075, partial [Moraxellaceae bacterium]|nr:hypothetical protein [Moraxellaceae bacterium]
RRRNGLHLSREVTSGVKRRQVKGQTEVVSRVVQGYWRGDSLLVSGSRRGAAEKKIGAKERRQKFLKRWKIAAEGIFERGWREVCAGKNLLVMERIRIRVSKKSVFLVFFQKKRQKIHSSACILYQLLFFVLIFFSVVHAFRISKLQRRRSLNGSFHEESCCEEAGPQAGCPPCRSRDQCCHFQGL